MKQIVHYSALIVPPQLGCRATVVPVDHPDVENVMNGTPAYTSLVQSIHADGEFETVYTRYVPMEE